MEFMLIRRSCYRFLGNHMNEPNGIIKGSKKVVKTNCLYIGPMTHIMTKFRYTNLPCPEHDLHRC